MKRPFLLSHLGDGHSHPCVTGQEAISMMVITYVTNDDPPDRMDYLYLTHHPFVCLE